MGLHGGHQGGFRHRRWVQLSQRVRCDRGELGSDRCLYGNWASKEGFGAEDDGESVVSIYHVDGMGSWRGTRGRG